MQNPLEEQSSPQRWIFLFLIVGLIAITVLFVISRIFQYSGPELLNSPYSTEPRMRTYDLGTARFIVPENMVRLPEQRETTELNKLDLVMLWPQLEGFSLENQVAFSDVSTGSKLIFAALTQSQQAISSSERLYSVYSQHFIGDPIEGPGNLIGFAMDPDSGFAGEVIYFKPDQSDPFVARCVKPLQGRPTFCMRDVMLNNDIQLSYRVRLNMLKDWRRLDEAVTSRIRSFQLQ